MPRKTLQKPFEISGRSTDSLRRLSGVVPLLPYQKRWIEDDSKLKIVRKGRQSGYSFSAALRGVLKCLEAKRVWIFLSKGERQSRLLMDKVNDHVKALGIAAEFVDSNFMEGTLTKQLEVRLPNGSVIYGLPANPDTARGYTGNVTLDEFAFHTDADKIYTALYPTITRGYSIEIISTPNGKQGMYYDLAKRAGLVDGEDANPNSPWSAHHVDIYDAAAQGLADMVPESDTRVDPALLEKILLGFTERGYKPTARMLRFVAVLRSGVDDEEAWLQEYCCQFISTAENFFPPELYKDCLNDEASATGELRSLVNEPGEFFLGVDIGRKHDLTVLWLDRSNEAVVRDATGRDVRKLINTCRNVTTLRNMPFQDQLQHIRERMSLVKPPTAGRPGEKLIRRCCIDATGMGAPLAESLASEFGGRVEPVTFTAPVKEDLAFRTLRRAQGGMTLLPDHDPIRRAFGAVKKVVTGAGTIRFDSERTDAGHSDEFWAKSLADLAAEQPTSHLSDGYLAGRARTDEWLPQAMPIEF